MAFSIITLATATASGLTGFSLTIIIAIITCCLTAMATAVKLFGPQRKINEQTLRESPYLRTLEIDLQDKEKKFNSLKELVHEEHTEIEKLKVETKNSSKTLEELKRDNRDLVQRLDYLLKQFMEYMDG